MGYIFLIAALVVFAVCRVACHMREAARDYAAGVLAAIIENAARADGKAE